MEIQEFIEKFAEQFDDTDVSELNPETEFKELDEWTSLTSLTVIAMVDELYGIYLRGEEIRKAKTLQDLFEVVKSKESNR